MGTEKRFCRRVGTPRNFLLFMVVTVGLLALLTTWMITETENNQVTLRRRLPFHLVWDNMSSRSSAQAKTGKKKPDQVKADASGSGTKEKKIEIRSEIRQIVATKSDE